MFLPTKLRAIVLSNSRRRFVVYGLREEFFRLDRSVSAGRTVSAVAIAMLAMVLAACNNSSSSGGGIGTPCPALVLAPPVLLYPKPGATAVPLGVGVLILSNIGSLGGSVTLTSATSGIAVGAFGPAPSPLPSGAATPQPGATAQAASISQLSASNTYTVNFTGNSPPGSSCGPLQAGGAIGSFST